MLELYLRGRSMRIIEIFKRLFHCKKPIEIKPKKNVNAPTKMKQKKDLNPPKKMKHQGGACKIRCLERGQ